MRKQVLGIFCSDLHLSETPPVARSEEEDWFAAMKRPLDQLKDLSVEHEAPIFYVGDIFHSWKCKDAGLINFALRWLPPGYAIPGQHDLPYHNIEEVEKSPYHTLELTNRIKTIWDKKVFDSFTVHGFPWGKQITDIERGNSLHLEVAIIHAYIWKKKHGYYGAKEEALVDSWLDKLQSFDAVFFGDNHKGFLHQEETLQVLNCGAFLRRNTDERDYKPHVGLLLDTGEVQLHYLDVSEDVFVEEDHLVEIEAYEELNAFDEFMESADEVVVYDYREALLHYLAKLGYKVRPQIKDIILKIIEEGK